MREKIFHDTVHGDILVPFAYCNKLIDTILFQRLRRIEQTSMRSLYPCARHDRFIHSLGVFHLGKIFVENIETNSKKENLDFWNSVTPFWEKIIESYKIACLLHDIGHSPFSHTFESYFDLKKPKLTDQLINLVDNKIFEEDFDQSPDPKPHEKTSAYITYKIYNDAISELYGDPIYVIRMILGICFHEPKDLEQKIVNCIIPLLHGVIDVDRLDYACRDQWASGFSSARVNLNRIIGSGLLIIIGENVNFCFNKNAISQLQSLFDIKNYQKTWVLGHQKILYDQFILIESIEEFASDFAEKHGETKDDILSKLFNINVFLDANYNLNGHNVYLLSDDDVIHLMKQSLNDNAYAKEWLSRNQTKKPLWKTESQYMELFANINLITDVKIKCKIDQIKKDKNVSFTYSVLPAKRGIDSIMRNEVKIYLNEHIVDYSIFNYNKSYNDKDFDKVYYVFIEKEYLSYKDEIISEIRKIS